MKLPEDYCCMFGGIKSVCLSWLASSSYKIPVKPITGSPVHVQLSAPSPTGRSILYSSTG